MGIQVVATEIGELDTFHILSVSFPDRITGRRPVVFNIPTVRGTILAFLGYAVCSRDRFRLLPILQKVAAKGP